MSSRSGDGAAMQFDRWSSPSGCAAIYYIQRSVRLLQPLSSFAMTLRHNLPVKDAKRFSQNEKGYNCRVNCALDKRIDRIFQYGNKNKSIESFTLE